eukprot:TRINITY_DN6911_c0_g2_i1.p2 TRINITY_DN6911_c0_g2~~TRINITY_DN6911_c0_g2_i1.p2  ORF type:complete len:166 (-),score=27.88 TRINITY_DN6911_c0_g2_i1:9-506(-)
MPYELCVKSQEQNILVLKVEESDTILDLKKSIESRLEKSLEAPLYFNGAELADEDASLLEYNIVQDDCPGGPVVNLGASPWDSFDVECKLPSGGSLKERITCETTVAQLKGRITSQAGIPYLCMKLFAGDVELRDCLQFAHYRLPSSCCIKVATTRPLYAGPAAA